MEVRALSIRMRALTSILRIPVFVLYFLTLTSCHTDDLCYLCPEEEEEAQSITVAYDWASDRTANPAGMRISFRRLDGESTAPASVFDLPGRDGGKISLPAGKYAVLTYNNDTESVELHSSDSWESSFATSPESDVLAPMRKTRCTGTSLLPKDDEKVRTTPDRIWSASLDTVEIRPSKASQTITFKPEPRFCEYDFKITNVANLSRVKSMSAALTGMADGISLRDGTLSATRCTHSLQASKKDDSTITGDFLAFGHNPSDTTSHYMELYIITEDGKAYRYHGGKGTKWDVTDQLEKAPDQRHVSILIDGLKIPDADSGESNNEDPEGLDPGIDDWDDIHVVIPL